MSAARYRSRSERRRRRPRGEERTSFGPVAKRWNGQAYPPIGFKIDIPFVDRLRSLEKIAERFGAASLSLSPSHSMSVFLLSLLFPFSFFLCRSSGRCQDALPRAITQWPPLFLRGYHAPIVESSDPREIMDCHDALSITSPRMSAGIADAMPAPRFRRATIRSIKRF